jgi:hypothetical protein
MVYGSGERTSLTVGLVQQLNSIDPELESACLFQTNLEPE